MVVAAERALNLGPDHYARLTAVKRFLELLTGGRPVRSTSEKRRAIGRP
jgi:hypothetical protein